MFWITLVTGSGLLLMPWISLWFPPAPPLTFAPRQSWTERWRNAVVQFFQRRWNRRTREELSLLKWPPALLLIWIGLFALLTGLPTVVITHNRVFALWAAVVGAWWGPQIWIHRTFVAWQRELTRDFVPLTLLLSVYFDLGLSPEDAFLATRAAVGPVTRDQIDYLLTLWHQQQGTPAEAVQAWAKRLRLLPYQQLADVIASNWDHGLVGDALKPLQTLVSAQQQQGARTVADQLDSQLTVVPAVVILGLMILIMYSFFAAGFGTTSGGVTFF